jgi:hypothetical protein
MNQSIHQLMQLVLEGIAWVLKTIELLWNWSWTQITGMFNMSWGNLPAWKMVIGAIAIAILAGILLVMARRGMEAFGKIAGAFWTMVLTMLAIVSFVVVAGVTSRGFQWVVATVPDRFWEKFL